MWGTAVLFLRKMDNSMANWYIIQLKGPLLHVCTYQTFFCKIEQSKACLKCSTASKSNKLVVISRFLVKSLAQFLWLPILLRWSTATTLRRNQTGFWVSFRYQVWPCNVSHMSFYQMGAISRRKKKRPACNERANKMAVCCTGNEYFKRSGHLLKSMQSTLRSSEGLQSTVGIAVWLWFGAERQKVQLRVKVLWRVSQGRV